jgi:N6-L-threonylcarbamoyladenine synthase
MSAAVSNVSAALGIDTSNYTTSAAVVRTDGSCRSEKRLLPVPEGTTGLRQSDAVFAHVKQFSEVFSRLDISKEDVRAIGVSTRPRNVDGSYMPCFIYGISVAETLSSALAVPLYVFSHQQGHIGAAILSCGEESLLERPFMCFHASGGTTEFLRVDGIERISVAACTGDISVGQLIDRVGVMLGMPFPSGPYLEDLAEKGDLPEKPAIRVKDGHCSLSGFENKAKNMLEKGVLPENIARYTIETVSLTVKRLCEEYNPEKLPILFVGGVMSNKRIRSVLSGDGRFFAEPRFSSDNAAGIAYLAMKKHFR